MKSQDYSVTLTVDLSTQETFKRINNVTEWWTKNVKGSSHQLNDEFSVQFGDIHYSKQKLVELVPDKKIVWLVTESKLTFVKTQDEWTNTRVSFELTPLGNKTQLLFTHHGLVPEFECFNGCSSGWNHYIKGSLLKLLTEGKGNPD